MIDTFIYSLMASPILSQIVLNVMMIRAFYSLKKERVYRAEDSYIFEISLVKYIFIGNIVKAYPMDRMLMGDEYIECLGKRFLLVYRLVNKIRNYSILIIISFIVVFSLAIFVVALIDHLS